MSENKKVTEFHGCIVCGRVFNVLVVYTPDGRLLDCAVTDPGSHCVTGERQALVACDKHTSEEIESAHKKWQSSKGKDTNDEEDN